MLRSDAYQAIQIVYEYVSPISLSLFMPLLLPASLFNECSYHRASDTHEVVQKIWLHNAKNAISARYVFFDTIMTWMAEISRDDEWENKPYEKLRRIKINRSKVDENCYKISQKRLQSTIKSISFHRTQQTESQCSLRNEIFQRICAMHVHSDVLYDNKIWLSLFGRSCYP